MGIAFVDAARLAESNRTRWKELQAQYAALLTQVEGEAAGFDARRRSVYDLALLPFRDTIVQLRSVAVTGLVDTEPDDVLGVPVIDVHPVRIATLGWLGSLAGGLAAGAGTGAASFAGVGAFAAASTGTPIAALSGVAATNATLAWLGGGALAAGGGGIAAGTAVLGGLVVAPAAVAAAGFGSVKGRRERAAQRRTAQELDVAEAAFAGEESRWAPVVARYQVLRRLLAELEEVIADRVRALRVLVDTNDDYSTYAPGQQRWLAELVGLVIVATEMMASPPDDKARCDRIIADARRRLANSTGQDNAA